MNRQELVVGQVHCDHFEHVAGTVRPDNQQLWRIGIGVEVDHDKRVFDGVVDVRVVNAVPSGRTVDLHTLLM